jgi:hypothetical protein
LATLAWNKDLISFLSILFPIETNNAYEVASSSIAMYQCGGLRIEPTIVLEAETLTTSPLHATLKWRLPFSTL